MLRPRVLFSLSSPRRDFAAHASLAVSPTHALAHPLAALPHRTALAPDMASDAGRQGFAERAEHKLVPDSSKSTTGRVGDNLKVRARSCCALANFSGHGRRRERHPAARLDQVRKCSPDVHLTVKVCAPARRRQGHWSRPHGHRAAQGVDGRQGAFRPVDLRADLGRSSLSHCHGNGR